MITGAACKSLPLSRICKTFGSFIGPRVSGFVMTRASLLSTRQNNAARYSSDRLENQATSAASLPSRHTYPYPSAVVVKGKLESMSEAQALPSFLPSSR